jgi:hypothetical protein
MPDEHDLSGSRILEEALGEAGGGEQRQPDDFRPPATGGLKPMIDRKRKEIIDLEKKMETHEETGAYSKRGSDGSTLFDYVSMQKDTVLLGRLKREYDELRERDREFATRATTQSTKAQDLARRYLTNELPKVPEATRKLAGEMFASIFKGMMDRNEWAKPVYADRAKVQEVIEQIFDTAYGHALRRGSTATPGSSGFDDDDDPKPKPRAQGDDDPFTENLLYAHDRVRRGSMSVADARRAALAATKRGDGQ